MAGERKLNIEVVQRVLLLVSLDNFSPLVSRIRPAPDFSSPQMSRRGALFFPAELFQRLKDLGPWASANRDCGDVFRHESIEAVLRGASAAGFPVPTDPALLC